RFLREAGKQALDCHTRTDLFEMVCREAVALGCFRMAWVGILHGDHVVPVSIYGEGQELVRQSRIIMNASHLHDPLCAAVHQNRISVLGSVDDADMPAWFAGLRVLGIASLAVIPLHFKHKVVGIMVLCYELVDEISVMY